MKTINEPPSCVSHLVIIGRNACGKWIAQEQHGMFGGVFVNRAQAMKYALSENGDHPATIVLTADIIELNLGARGTVSPRPVALDAGAYRDRAA